MKKHYYDGYMTGVIPDGEMYSQSPPRACPMCGKAFRLYCAVNEYGYQGPMKTNKPGHNENVLFCSYSCMRKAEKALNIPRDYVELEAAMEAKEARQDSLARARWARRWGKHKKTLEELDDES